MVTSEMAEDRRQAFVTSVVSDISHSRSGWNSANPGSDKDKLPVASLYLESNDPGERRPHTALERGHTPVPDAQRLLGGEPKPHTRSDDHDTREDSWVSERRKERVGQRYDMRTSTHAHIPTADGR